MSALYEIELKADSRLPPDPPVRPIPAEQIGGIHLQHGHDFLPVLKVRMSKQKIPFLFRFSCATSFFGFH
ncbi:hypothetical protein MSKU15_3503 [Komagataeibacter diospyri]|nr:hypothetical protein MSKU15_3503 [Komagataeibacter diospyri]